MNYKIKYMLPLIILLVACNEKQSMKNTKEKEVLLFPKGEKITNNNFTGTVYLQMLMEADSLNPTSVGNVTFEPGARTKWHLHPGGQILLVTNGVGYYQEKGQSKKTLNKGDVIKCPPNIPHWHGATPSDTLVHIAIGPSMDNKGKVVWLEAVTDEEYIK